jgi:D-alanyl-D-alanine carboxypeptidase (penicillin-binding protein 5/6)
MKFLKYLVGFIALTLVMTDGLWVVYGSYFVHNPSIKSPIPNFLMRSYNNQVDLLDFWTPVAQVAHGDSGELTDLTAESVLMYDLSENKILYEKDPTIRRPMASLTKIMTAIIALENQKPDDKYNVIKDDIVGQDSMGVTPGEVYDFQDLFYGLLLPSGNDAAEVFAHNYPLGRAGFVVAMNNKAKALGMLNTHYTNPSGLQGDGDQYTTAFDLLILTRYALSQYPQFAQAVSTYTYIISQTTTHKELDLANETNLLTTYPGVKGVKTGYTPEAGLCLVTYLDYGGHKIIGIILNSQNRRGEMKSLLDYSLKTVGVTPPPYED